MKLQTPTLGALCVSLTGHDKGRTYVVVKIPDPDFVFVADGKYRSVKNPKKKRIKHLKQTGQTVSGEFIALLAEGKAKDNEIRKFILSQAPKIQ